MGGWVSEKGGGVNKRDAPGREPRVVRLNFRETGLDALLNRLTRDSRESCVARFGSFPCNLGVLFAIPGILNFPSFA